VGLRVLIDLVPHKTCNSSVFPASCSNSGMPYDVSKYFSSQFKSEARLARSPWLVNFWDNNATGRMVEAATMQVLNPFHDQVFRIHYDYRLQITNMRTWFTGIRERRVGLNNQPHVLSIIDISMVSFCQLSL
jgi:hypothetical protein